MTRPRSSKSWAINAYNKFQVELDMVIDAKDIDAVGSMSRGGVLRDCELRKTIQSYGLGLRIIEIVGPGGGNPFVLLFGSKKNLTRYLKDHMEDDDGYLASLIEHYENVRTRMKNPVSGSVGHQAL